MYAVKGVFYLKYLSNIDLNQNELQNARLQNLATAPSSPLSGQSYFNTTINKAYMWNGTSWVELTSVGTITTITGSSPIVSSLSGSTVTISINPASGTSAGSMSSTDFTKLSGVAPNANNYVHPNHTGDITSTGDGVTAISTGVIIDSDVNASAAIGWTKISKTGSSLADLATRSAGDLSSGTLLAARLPALAGDITMAAGTNTTAITAGVIVNSDINASAAIDTTKIGTGTVSNTEFSYLKGVTSPLQTQLSTKADLDGGGKLLTSQLPDSIVGQVKYQGTWNASTNTPALATASTVKGYYYVVSVAGIYSTVDYNIGDWIISNGSAWEKVDNTDAVPTVFGRTGNILPATNDYTWAQINKATSSLADITTRSASDLTSGTLLAARMPALTGDIITTAGTVATSLAPSGVTAGTYTSVTVDPKGRVIGGSTPIASSTVLGGVKIGANLIMTDGVLSVGNNAIDSNYAIKTQSYIATEGQRIFTLTNGTYLTGRNMIDVRLDGQWQDSDAFNETSPTSITLSAGISAGTKVDIKYIQGYSGSLFPTHGSEHVTGGIDVIPDAIAGGNSGLMSGNSLLKLNGIANNATAVANSAVNGIITINGVNQTVYDHPTGDGNLHVPVTGTTNNGKVLKAGATVGSIGWGNVAYSELTGSGSSSISTVGTITTGVWNASTIAIANGGTGATSVAVAKTNLGFMTRYAASIGNGTLTTFPVTHNLGTKDVQVTIYDASTNEQVSTDIVMTSTSVVTLNFAVPPTTNQYRVVVMG